MSSHRLTFLIVTGVLIIGSFGVLISMEESVDAVGDPAITIELHQTSMTANVEPGQDGLITFTGDVFAEAPWSPETQYLIVYLYTDAGGWSTSSPEPLVFTKDVKVQSFIVTVQVPPRTSHMVQGMLTVSGKWNYSPGVMGGSVDETTAIIHIAQYFDCDLDTTTPSLEAERGGNAEFSVILVNEGNGYDEMIVDIENRNDLNDRGIGIQVVDKVVPVPEEQTVEISVIASVRDGTSIGGYTISVHVRSKLAEDLGEPCDTDYMELNLIVVREISEPEEEPEETPEEDEEDPDETLEEDQEDNEAIPEDPVGDNVDETMEENPEYNPGDRKLPAPGIVGVIFSILVVAIIYRKTRRK